MSAIPIIAGSPPAIPIMKCRLRSNRPVVYPDQDIGHLRGLTVAFAHPTHVASTMVRCRW